MRLSAPTPAMNGGCIKYAPNIFKVLSKFPKVENSRREQCLTKQFGNLIGFITNGGIFTVGGVLRVLNSIRGVVGIYLQKLGLVASKSPK
jgi:hypothetical protein